MSAPTTRQTEVAVIGAGPGGYAAAFQAAVLGKQVTLINAEPEPGGVCLHRGCIPSKSLLHVARVIAETREARALGITFGEPRLDLDGLRAWKNQVVDRLASGVAGLVRQHKIEYVNAWAGFRDANTLLLKASPQDEDGEPLRFRYAVLASGSAPTIPPPFRFDSPRIMDSTGALALEEIPEQLLIIGGGYIGLELGTAYATLGSRVTVVEMTDGLMPGVDRDLVKPLQDRLAKQFEAIYLNTRVEQLEPHASDVIVTLKGDQAPSRMRVNRVLVAVGRRPVTDGLGLENTGVELDEHGFVRADRQQRTAEATIFAIGDVAGEPMLAHKASREGKIAAEVISGEPSRFENAAIPAVVFTDPEIAWAGLTETQAQARGIDVEVSRFPWAASGRALTLNRPEGLTKVLIEPGTERVLGVGIVGPGAAELIAEGVLAVEMAAVARDIADSIHPHPTLTETVAEAGEALFGEATHVYRPRR